MFFWKNRILGSEKSKIAGALFCLIPIVSPGFALTQEYDSSLVYFPYSHFDILEANTEKKKYKKPFIKKNIFWKGKVKSELRTGSQLKECG